MRHQASASFARGKTYLHMQEREIEAALWKNVFYKPIEEFRKRIRQAAGLGDKGTELLRKASRHTLCGGSSSASVPAWGGNKA